MSKSKINEIARKRREIVEELERSFVSLEESLQRRLLSVVNKNIDSPNLINRITQFLSNNANPKIVRNINNAVRRLATINKEYYSFFGKPSGYTDIRRNIGKLVQNAVTSNSIVQNRVINALTAMQARNLEPNEMRKEISKVILGTEDKLGVIEFRDQYIIRLQDIPADSSRQMQEQSSEELGLNYAIYQGGTIDDTRSFCAQRNANVYNRETILGWNQLEWDGKKAGNVIINAGGYNCRHYFDWISFELAKEINPNIKKSTFD